MEKTKWAVFPSRQRCAHKFRTASLPPLPNAACAFNFRRQVQVAPVCSVEVLRSSLLWWDGADVVSICAVLRFGLVFIMRGPVWPIMLFFCSAWRTVSSLWGNKRFSFVPSFDELELKSNTWKITFVFWRIYSKKMLELPILSFMSYKGQNTPIWHFFRHVWTHVQKRLNKHLGYRPPPPPGQLCQEGSGLFTFEEQTDIVCFIIKHRLNS